MDKFPFSVRFEKIRGISGKKIYATIPEEIPKIPRKCLEIYLKESISGDTLTETLGGISRKKCWGI